MDFFAQQDLARRNTRLLVVLFLAAVLLLVLLTNVIIAAFLFFGEDYNVYSGGTGVRGFLSYFSWERFGTIGLTVTATVALVVLVKWFQLSTGGKTVAESMGGVQVLPQSRDPAERRCLNVVEEIALAANMPVPPLYVMNSERGINAFAAGITPADAVVAVTRGTIDHLKRHELQGVIAHEFSHILNGDMRLNIRLAALLKGITFIGDVGHFLLRSTNRRSGSSNRNSGPALPLLGLGLLVLGWLGGIAAGFIKSAISRQKEFLADAGAVQFTRDSDTIGDALKVIGGYIPGTLVHAARANELSHMFFGQIEHRLWQLFATHPPLASRIHRVDPDWDGQYIERKPRHYPGEPSGAEAAGAGVGRAALVAAALAGALAGDTANGDREVAQQGDADFDADPEALERETATREDIPLVFVQHSHEPMGAQALVFSLLIDPGAAIRQVQMRIIADTGVRGLDLLVNTLYPGVQELGAPRRLPLLEMCLPALKSMSTPQYQVFKDTLLGLIRADESTRLHEWCLFQLVRHYLDPEFTRIRPSRARHRRLQAVEKEIRTVLSVLAHESAGDTGTAFRRCADSLGFTRMTIEPRIAGDVAAFSRAVHVLADCYPLLKPRVLKAMCLAAGVTGELNPVEREIIASVAAVMDCPLPSL